MDLLNDFVDSLQVKAGTLFCDVASSSHEHNRLTSIANRETLRLLTPLSGNIQLRTSETNKLIDLKPGHGAVLSQGSAAEIICVPAARELQLFDFTISMAATAAAPLLEGLPSILVLDDRVIASGWQKWVNELVDESRAEQPGSAVAIDAYAALLILALLRQHVLPIGLSSAMLASRSDAIVRRTLAILHRRYDESWTLDRLAADVGLSRSALGLRFRRATMMSPMSYLLQVRMEKAEVLLDEGALTHAEIAERLGYHSRVAFQRARSRFLTAQKSTSHEFTR